MGKENELLSIVMPVFDDNISYLKTAIDSVLNQTYSFFELIIICEFGTKDQVKKVLYDYAIGDSRIILVENIEKLGLAESLNKGFRMATGKYIFRMDADDVCYPKRLEMQYKFMEKNPDLIISGGNIRIIQDNVITRQKRRYRRKENEIRMAMLFQCELAHPTVVLNRERFMQLNLKYKVDVKTEDYDLWTDFIFDYPVANLNRTILSYRIHSDSASGKEQEKVEKSSRDVQKKILKKYGIELEMQRRFSDGVSKFSDLVEYENALFMLLKNYSSTFSAKNVFRREMETFYETTQKQITDININSRYWIVFGEFYGKWLPLYKLCDKLLHFIKKLWRIIKKILTLKKKE